MLCMLLFINIAGNGASSDPCSYQIYKGSAGNSEMETKAIGKFICSIAHRLYAMVTVHMFGELVLFPWGNTKTKGDKNKANCELAADHNELVRHHTNNMQPDTNMLCLAGF